MISSSGQKQTTTTPAITINSLLRLLCPIKGFLFQCVEIAQRKTLLKSSPKQLIKVTIVPRKNSRPVCSCCHKPGATYDTAKDARAFDYIPLWNIPVRFYYRMRRVRRQHLPITRLPSYRVPKTQVPYRIYLSTPPSLRERDSEQITSLRQTNLSSPPRLLGLIFSVTTFSIFLYFRSLYNN